MTDRQLNCALDLMRRLPPSQIEKNLSGLIDFVPDLTEQLLSSVDQPLRLAECQQTKKIYLLCDYNRDGDSYRSPWSNKYDPALDDGTVPSGDLRKLEIQANDAFDIYRELYYEGGHSSVYCWDLDHGFAACILIKKTQDTSRKGQPMKGTWDAIHVIEVKDNKKSAHYKLTSTVMLTIETKTEATGSVSLAGSLTRQAEQDAPVSDADPHISNIGKMVEEMELRFRTNLETLYFSKTKDTVNELRNFLGVGEANRRKNLQQAIGTSMGSKK